MGGLIGLWLGASMMKQHLSAGTAILVVGAGSFDGIVPSGVIAAYLA